MTRVLFARVDEDLALIEEMVNLVPRGDDDWRPNWPGETPFSITELVAHLTDSCGGLCGCFARLHPQLTWTKSEPAPFGLSSYRRDLARFRELLREGFDLTEDADLLRVIPTYFSPEGEPFLAVLLNNLKHVNHHAHQLFIYLKLMGVPVNSRHLYRFK